MEKICNLQNLNILKNTNLKIGLLGGSFNPPHLGHLEISNLAIKILSLNYIIWVVAKQNSLKPRYKLDIFTRANLAANLTQHNNRIIISTFENELKQCFTAYVLNFLCKNFNKNKFIFIIGSDVLSGIHLWEQVEEIPKLVNLVIFERPKYSYEAMHNKLLNKLGYKICYNTCLDKNNKIYFYRTKLNYLSSTLIKSKT